MSITERDAASGGAHGQALQNPGLRAAPEAGDASDAARTAPLGRQAPPGPPAADVREGRAVSAPGPQTRGQLRRPVVRPPRRRRSTVRKVDPWSVLKLSVIFYLFVLLVVMLALTVFWAVVHRLGAIDALYTIAADTFNVQLRFDGANIARALLLIGVVNVVLISALNVFLAFLYNLIADLVGGLRVVLETEE